MWPFKRKKNPSVTAQSGPVCTFCRSTNTILVHMHGTEMENPVKTWRGQRYLTCRCRDCGHDFYAEEGTDGAQLEEPNKERLVDNEEELKAAEEELDREIRDNHDRTFG
jgi:hypothetical protein